MRASLLQRLLTGCLLMVFAAGASLPCRAAGSTAAEQALAQGRVDDAIAAARASLQTDAHSAPAHLLLCRAFYSEEAADEAVNECQAAAASAPNDGVTQDWLGRALGLKADRAGPFAGYSLAKKVRDAFEAAARLNPRSADAFDDLAEYYVAAPSIVGGGLDKAAALAAGADSSLAERARVLRAHIAEKQKDYGTAERELKTLAQESKRPDAWADLGAYYGRRHDTAQAVAAYRRAVELDNAHDSTLVHVAESLIKLKTEPQFAMQALRAYLGGKSLSESAPACKAHTLLGKLLASSGDKNGARAELQLALSLASGYAPAKKELKAL